MTNPQTTYTPQIEQIIVKSSKLVRLLECDDEIEGMRPVTAQFVGDWCDDSWMVTLVRKNP